MKKLLLILSALLLITGCKVTSTSSFTPEEDDEYSDGIYLFYANRESNRYKIKVDYIYEDNSAEITDTYFIDFDEIVSDIIKVDLNKLKLLHLTYLYKGQDRFADGMFVNLDKSSFSNLESGLYVAEFFLNIYTNVYLRKTESLDYYLNKVDFYDDKTILFIRNRQRTELPYKLNNRADKKMSFNDNDNIRRFIVNPLVTDIIYSNGSHEKIIEHKLSLFSNFLEFPQSIDLANFYDEYGSGYYYTEVKSGRFSTPVKLNSYKDILE